MQSALKKVAPIKQDDQQPGADGRPAHMSEKRWKQHLAWKKVMAEGQSTADPSWRTSSKNLCK